MTDIEPFLERLGLLQYYDVLVEEGFETWETLLDVQETDLEALGVKLGHRRRLQRAIAEYRGFSSDRPLGSPSQDVSGQEISKMEDALTRTLSSKEGLPSGTAEPKRKYRRHPKPDEHAPDKPPSAYVLFSNKVREEVRRENLSFTETARLVGERWQKLGPAQKEPFESYAASLKETYNSQLADYKRTDAYREYVQYLADFKAKHGPINESKTEHKRAKLEAAERSSSWVSSSTMDNREATPYPFLHARASSGGSHSSVAYSAPSTTGSTSLQVTTSLPTMGAPDRRRGSPSHHFTRERQLPGSISGQSSGPEDMPTTRMEQGDPHSHASGLPLSPARTNSPPPPTTGTHRTGRTDLGYSSGSPAWPRQRLANFTGAAQQSDSPTKTYSQPPFFNTSPGEISRDRHQEVGITPHGILPPPHRSQQHQQPQSPLKGALPISHLMGPNVGSDAHVASAQRILPLPYSPTGPQTQPSSSMFGQPSIPASVSPFQPTADRAPLAQRYASAVRRRSDDEAANALAGLSNLPSSSRAKDPRSTR